MNSTTIGPCPSKTSELNVLLVTVCMLSFELFLAMNSFLSDSSLAPTSYPEQAQPHRCLVCRAISHNSSVRSYSINCSLRRHAIYIERDFES
jgi:hypothetical protein